MSDQSPMDTVSATSEPKWQPVGAVERRILGVLVEKAKTTPDAYPMTLNAITTGCNQKNNRDPQMNLESDQVDQALENLRKLGAVAEVQGGGRVPKYRHYLYEWLGVDKVELAVMAELLLRGPQMVGELRGRAARMEPIADVAALQPVIESLRDKGLIVALTPRGRGQTIAHALYPPEQLEKIQRQFQAGTAEPADVSSPDAAASAPSPPAGDLAALRAELDELKSLVQQIQAKLNELTS